MGLARNMFDCESCRGIGASRDAGLYRVSLSRQTSADVAEFFAGRFQSWRNGLQAIEKQLQLANRLDDERFACADRLGHAALRAVASPRCRAAKQASSSGTTPHARRRVASFWASSSFCCVLDALAIRAL